MTRSGALLWKEWRDHRAAILLFALLVPLVSWPVQRYIFKFAEPEWTWRWMVPICVGMSVAVVAADSFAMDIATSRMASMCALPVSLTRHFTVRTTFLAFVAALFTVWTAICNTAIVAVAGKSGAAALLFGNLEPAGTGLVICAAAAASVVLLSALGVGGLRAVIGGVLLVACGFIAVDFAGDRLAPFPAHGSSSWQRVAIEWTIATAVLSVAAYAGFIGSRGHVSRRRGALVAAAILVLAFGAPAGAAAWTLYRGWIVSPTDPSLYLHSPSVSPDGRHVAIVGQPGDGVARGTYRSWIVRIDDGATFTWPRRNEYVAGWTTDGLAWVGRVSQSKQADPDDFGWFAHVETGKSAGPARRGEIASRLAVVGGGIGPHWTNWMWGENTPLTNLRPGERASTWRLWVKDGNVERKIDACTRPTPTPKIGEVLYITLDHQLALIDLAGGAPRIVANDALDLQGNLAGSSDGRYYLVGTSKGSVVLEAGTWRTVAGPFAKDDGYHSWCVGSDARAILSVSKRLDNTITKLIDVASNREIELDSALAVLGGYGSVSALADGRLVARSGSHDVLLLAADGKFIRRLFPPEE